MKPLLHQYRNLQKCHFVFSNKCYFSFKDNFTFSKWVIALSPKFRPMSWSHHKRSFSPFVGLSSKLSQLVHSNYINVSSTMKSLKCVKTKVEVTLLAGTGNISRVEISASAGNNVTVRLNRIMRPVCSFLVELIVKST